MLRLPLSFRMSSISPYVSSASHMPFYNHCDQFRYSTQAPKGPDYPTPKSSHVEFYKIFGRPIAKVLLMSACTYQLAFLLWVNEETKEKKAEKAGKSLKSFRRKGLQLKVQITRRLWQLITALG
ncbi:hypothetical protein HI914_03273 [Erysiphe necator]|nr:hypothetical protein HI914_03273 [Erysiphe necator]